MSAPETLNVLHVILNLERAGAQEVVRTLADYQQAGGCRVIVCALRDGPMRPEIENSGVTVVILPHRGQTKRLIPQELARLWHIRRELVRVVQQYSVDIVQTHLLETLDFIVLSLRRRTNLYGVLWTIHNVDFLPISSHAWTTASKRQLHRWLYRLTSRQVEGFVAVSNEVRDAIINEIGPVAAKIITIPNGVDVQRFEIPSDRAALCAELGINPDAYLLATVGRLTKQKGHSYLIEAAKMVLSAYPDTYFLCIGDGELRATLQTHSREAGLERSVHFLGIREDVPRVLASVDAFILPSLWEGLSIALLEAMAAGKPTVATAVSGTSQVMRDGETGLIVPPRDSQALAQAILRLLSNPAWAHRMGQAAKQHVKDNFSAQKQADEHIAVYRKLVSNRLAGNG